MEKTITSNSPSSQNCCHYFSLWTIFKWFSFLILFTLFGIFNLFGLISGAISSTLPDSYFLEKYSIILYSSYALIILIIFLFLTMKLKMLEKKQNGKPSLKYLGMRLRVSRYMEKKTESGSSWIQEILAHTKQSIVSNLGGSEEEEAKNLHQVEAMLKTLYKDLFDSASSEEEIQLLKKAVFFALKEKTIKHPIDLQGRRRCYILVELFSKVTDTSDSCLPSLSCLCLKTIIESCGKMLKFLSFYLPSFGNGSLNKKYSNKSILKTVTVMLFVTIVPYCFDIGTDVQMVMVYWTVWASAGNRSIESIITNTKDDSFFYPSTEIFLPVVCLSTFMFIFLVFTVLANPPKKWARLFKVKLRLASSGVENKNEVLTTPCLLRREDLSIHESSLESPFDIALQLSLFMYLEPFIHTLKELQPENPILEKYEEMLYSGYEVANIQIPALVVSMISSVYQITLGQVKRNNVFQLLNISWSQWILYVIASFWSTLAFLMVIAMTAQGLLGTVGVYNEVTRFAFYLLIPSTCLLMTAGPFTTWFTSSKKYKSKLRAPGSSWIMSPFTTFLLPPSQHITRGRYNIYHNSLMQSQDLLRRMTEQCGTYFLVIMLLMFLNGLDYRFWSLIRLDDTYACNATLCRLSISTMDLAQYQTKNISFLLPQTAICPNRLYMMIGTLVFIPVGLVMSYVFLSAYYAMDNGFFSGVNVGYIFENDQNENSKDKCKDNFCGKDKSMKEDTGDLREDKSNCYTNKNALDTWIDRDVEEDWFSLGKYLSQYVGKNNEWKNCNVRGKWMDLTGEEGYIEGYCSDGAVVLNGEEGSMEHSIKLSFPYYRDQLKLPSCCPCRCSDCATGYFVCCCCICCQDKELVETVIQMENKSDPVAEEIRDV